MQHAVEFMREHDVSSHVQAQVLSWTRFFHDHTAQNLRKKASRLALKAAAALLPARMTACP